MKKLLLLFVAAFSMLAGQSQCTFTEVGTTVTTSMWGQEISWMIFDDLDNLIYSSGQIYSTNETYDSSLCLEGGCYRLILNDTFGDGWNGAIIQMATPAGTLEWTLVDGNTGEFYFNLEDPNVECQLEESIMGCTDPNAINYNPFAWLDDNSCEYAQVIYGCMDPAANNYNPFATVDSGNCTYDMVCDSGQVLVDVYVCAFGGGADMAFELTSSDGTVLIDVDGYNNGAIEHTDVCLDLGECYTITAENIGGQTGWYGGYFWVNNMQGVQLIQNELSDNLSTESFIFSVDGTCGEVYGCTDPGASNYDPNATTDDGTCFYTTANDLCAEAMPLTPGMILIDNSGAVQNEGVYGDCWASGAGEGEQSSLWFSFTTPDFPAMISIEALGDNTYTLTDTQFGLFTECGGEMIACDGNSGAGLFSAFDFACGELEENTEYLLVVDGYYGDSGTCLLTYNVTPGCDAEVLGCTDPLALNYDPTANVNDGSCFYAQDSCDAALVSIVFNPGAFIQEVSFSVVDADGNEIASFDNLANQPYYMELCVEDGCYTIVMEDTFGDGWNNCSIDIIVDGTLVVAGLTLEQGSIGEVTLGFNDASCTEQNDIEGCTDPQAWNYNPAATIDDGTCYYDSIFVDCLASFELIGIDEGSDVVYLLNTSIASPDVNFLWTWGDGSYSEGAYPTHVYEEAGTYEICLTIESAWCWVTYCDSVTYDPAGLVGDGWNTEDGVNSTGWTINVLEENVLSVSDESLAEVSIYPSPAADVLFVNLAGVETQLLQAEILDLQGRVVYSTTTSTLRHNSPMAIDVSSLSTGTYVLRLMSEGKQSAQRFEVMR